MTRSVCQKGPHPIIKTKVVFYAIVWIFIDLMPVTNGFYPFLGDIGHFWRPDFGRKLGMDNQLQIYKN